MENKNCQDDSNHKRFADSLASKLNGDSNAPVVIIKSPTDIGVRRNKGRNGARFAPEAIEAALKKMANHLPYDSILSQNVSNQDDERSNYESSIELSARKIIELLKTPRSRAVHLGGGHDHAFPLLKALDESEGKNILIVNFDAHCDTRVDTGRHSGTPFRDFDKIAKKPFHLTQIGIHDFANSSETMSPLERNSEKIFFTKDLKEILSPESFVDAIYDSCPFTIDADTDLFISVDCDAISSSIMSAVSAVNHNGLSPEQTLLWVDTLKDFPCERKALGIYEYNPIFEDLSQKGARFLAGLIYNYLS